MPVNRPGSGQLITMPDWMGCMIAGSDWNSEKSSAATVGVVGCGLYSMSWYSFLTTFSSIRTPDDAAGSDLGGRSSPALTTLLGVKMCVSFRVPLLPGTT